MNNKRVSEKNKITTLLNKIAASVFTPSISVFCDKVLNKVKGEKLTELKKNLLFFDKILTEKSYTLQRIRDEPFFKTFLRLIINKDYLDNPVSFANSLSKFLRAMIDLKGGIDDIICRWDTPAGPPSEEYAYNELRPTLSSIDGIFYIEEPFYMYLNKQLSEILDDNGLTVKAKIFSAMDKMGLFQFSRPTIDSLTLETISQILKENFHKKGVKTFGCLKGLSNDDFVEGLDIYDFLFDFLEKSDAKVIDELKKLRSNGLRIELEYFSGEIKFHKCDLVFNHLGYVVGLSLKNLGLEQIQKNIYNLKELKILDLSLNKLRNISRSIRKLKNLEILYIHHNLLSKLPKSIGRLKSLRELYLSNNQLTIIPESIGNLLMLQTLHVYENKVVSIPQSIKNLSLLEDLLID